ncbi:uncharacterized protein EV154DRAFT_480454 [Mucor mucedo]|uniref:uncharacterized protein n=1 Tax=Mucor mucedo TaxID=29922 RepID=UPI0022202827|nr:uncharacterized protein EV154DRAFT_480454 [Mucor mucedo]KAI7892279.1 hypothetical protein EV154DRAFT_480454 [Mucor mucedo]
MENYSMTSVKRRRDFKDVLGDLAIPMLAGLRLPHILDNNNIWYYVMVLLSTCILGQLIVNISIGHGKLSNYGNFLRLYNVYDQRLGNMDCLGEFLWLFNYYMALSISIDLVPGPKLIAVTFYQVHPL